MYKAKKSSEGHHVYCIADDAVRLQTVQELRTALTTGQLVMYYQPKIDLDTGEVHAARVVAPDALQLEITEEFLMADLDRTRSILTRLRHSGVQICVDDFGTGYSSLSYLRDLPLDELKLDRSFIYPLAQDDRTAALVASTIALAHSLGLRMVAEGVQTDASYTELTRMGCDQAQGYFMPRPVPVAELDQWLRDRHTVDRSPDITKLRDSTALG
ncbi:MAG TPA: EAL domain-containing protein [Dermatophilaceae bacterium]